MRSRNCRQRPDFEVCRPQSANHVPRVESSNRLAYVDASIQDDSPLHTVNKCWHQKTDQLTMLCLHEHPHLENEPLHASSITYAMILTSHPFASAAISSTKALARFSIEA